MPIITNQWFWAIPILALWLGMVILGTKRERIAALLILVAVGSSDLICARLLKPTFKRLRPSHALEDVQLLVKKGGKYGFPSNHAANITAAMSVLIYFYRRYKYGFLTIAILVSLSRVYVGVHYPLDILTGIVTGVLLFFLYLLLWLIIANRELKKGKDYLSLVRG